MAGFRTAQGTPKGRGNVGNVTTGDGEHGGPPLVDEWPPGDFFCDQPAGRNWGFLKKTMTHGD